MGPKRKKSKPEVGATIETVARYGEPGRHPQQTTDSPTRSTQANISPPSVSAVESTSLAQPSAPSRYSWTGSWRAKASPVAQIARESVSVTQGATSESSSQAARPPLSVSKSVRGTRKSIPLAAAATRVHATRVGSDKVRARSPAGEEVKARDKEGTANDSKAEVVVEEARLPPDPLMDNNETGNVRSGETARPQSGTWFGWWSRPDGYGSDGEKKAKKQKMDAAEEANNTPLPSTTTEELTEPIKNAMDFEGIAGEAPGQDNKMQKELSADHASSRSWFWLWSSAQNLQTAAQGPIPAEGDVAAEPEVEPVAAVLTEPPEVESIAKEDESSKPGGKNERQDPPKTSGWAFWSADKPKRPTSTSGGTQTQVGELAVADTPSQSHPEAAQFNEQREQPKPGAKTTPDRSNSLLRPKRGRIDKAKEVSVESISVATSSEPTPAVSQMPTPSDTPPRDDSQAPSKPVKTLKAAQAQPNLILPSFRDTFPTAPNPGYVERLTHYLAHSLRLTGLQPLPPPPHVFISPSQFKVKRAVALGIHGFFPAALIQKVLGQPTGTSIRFANYAATSIKTWCQTNQPDIKDVEVEKVALEGEGYIGDRVSTLWKLLLNWLSHLRQADFIFVACHSQGVPVAIMLVEKLIQLGCLSPNIRIGVCAMAGINLGPFPEYKSRLFGGSALELFEFGDSKSAVSRAYADSLDCCLRNGVRVMFVGSIDDQLVSLESSLYAPLSHPYVARAVFIDGRLHAPNFLTHLVVFALKLRNLGISDHGLIRELSVPLAGSLVGGEGHSRVYDDPAVYSLAIDFALESTDAACPPPPSSTISSPSERDSKTHSAARRTSSISGLPLPKAHTISNHNRRTSLSATSQSLPGIPPIFAQYSPQPSNATANPFYLPWAVRGLLEEPIVKRDFAPEVEVLVREFEEWRPTSKVLKDVRWRLEGVRGMMG